MINIDISKIDTNSGQIAGLPSNPRMITGAKFEALKKSITDFPEMLEYRQIMVIEHKGRYVTIGGNMRLQALKELNYSVVPCVVLPKETSIEQLKAYTILDNNGFGKWDFDLLANEWDSFDLESWGVDVWQGESSEIDTGDNLFDNDDDNSELIKLEFKLSIEECNFVRKELSKIDANKEVALLKKLGFQSTI